MRGIPVTMRTVRTTSAVINDGGSVALCVQARWKTDLNVAKPVLQNATGSVLDEAEVAVLMQLLESNSAKYIKCFFDDELANADERFIKILLRNDRVVSTLLKVLRVLPLSPGMQHAGLLGVVTRTSGSLLGFGSCGST